MKPKTYKTSLLALLLAAFGLGLAGCSDNSSSNPPPSTPPAASTNSVPSTNK